MEEYEERWEKAGGGPATVAALDGDWRVRRLSGPVPMPFLWKSIRGDKGTTSAFPPSRRARGQLTAPGLPFRLEQREGHVALIYAGPLSFLLDELRPEADGSWLGRANAAGVRYAWFTLAPHTDTPRTL